MTLDRRGFLAACSQAGIASALLPGVLYTLAAQAQETAKPETPFKVTDEMLDRAAALAGVPFTADQKKKMLERLAGQRESYDAIRKLKLPNSVAPAFIFDPLPPGATIEAGKVASHWSKAASIAVSSNVEDLAFATVRKLAELVRTRKVTSLALTQMYLARLKRYDSKLHFVVTLTEERALAQAKAADAEIAAGHYRGLLHGIPWGAKDLLAVKGYPTTWGAGGFEKQEFEEDATVVQRLDAAGAVLVAKFTLGALAMGDKWFGGRTRNPWNPDQGSSGSSAGSASASRRGLRGFRDWLGDAGFDLFALYTMRGHGLAPDLWLCSAHRRDGSELDDGQTGADLPRGGGLRHRAEQHLRPGWTRILRRAKRRSTGTPISIGRAYASAI